MKLPGLFLISVLLSCSAIKTNKPLKNFDFKNHQWQIVYIEAESNPITYNCIQNIWLLNNNRIIDSLKNEYKCDLKKQCDGEKEYHIYLFRDNWHYNSSLFCNNKDYFSIGKLKSSLIPVNTKYFNCPNLHSTQVLIDSLKHFKVNYTITPTDSISLKINEFSIVLDLGVNLQSKLFQNNNPLFSTWTPNAKKELTRLFPEFTIEDVSSQPKGYGNVSAPGYSSSDYSKDSYYSEHTQLSFVLSSNYPIKLDLPRLKNTDLFLSYNIRQLYLVTTYSDKG